MRYHGRTCARESQGKKVTHASVGIGSCEFREWLPEGNNLLCSFSTKGENINFLLCAARSTRVSVVSLME